MKAKKRDELEALEKENQKLRYKIEALEKQAKLWKDHGLWMVEYEK